MLLMGILDNLKKKSKKNSGFILKSGIILLLDKQEQFNKLASTATFGIGTNLTNDVGNGIKGLNIVMKLFRCKMIEKDRWNECIKLSDVAGKHTGSVEELPLAQRVLGIGG